MLKSSNPIEKSILDFLPSEKDPEKEKPNLVNMNTLIDFFHGLNPKKTKFMKNCPLIFG